MFFAIDLRCRECDEVWDSLVPKEEAERTDWPCPACQKAAGFRIPSAPNRTKRTFIDGTKRPGFQKLREQDAIERAMEQTQKPADKFKLVQERERIYQTKS